MAIIYVYPLKAIPSDADLIPITDSTSTNPQEATKNISISSLGTLINTNTTYDLTSVQNASDSDIKLTGSDATVDIVKLVAGTDISIVDSGSNITINSTGGTGTVTSITTVNAIGASSGIKFLANPNPITGAGVIDFEYSGIIGDILYADSTTSLAKLGAGTAKTVLTSNGPGFAPAWASPVTKFESAQDIIVPADVNLILESTDLTTQIVQLVAGTNITLTDSGTNKVEIKAAGGGGVNEAEGTFTPILVTQGANGLGTLQDLNGLIANFVYTAQYGNYYILNKQLYIDFYIEFQLGAEASTIQDTLGVSAFDVTGTTPATNVLGLQGIDALALNLSQRTKNNAGVDITDVESNGGATPAIIGWDHAPQGGKLNKYFGAGDATTTKSVAWFHWLSQPLLAGEIRTAYNVSAGTWANMDGNKDFVIAGSLNPIAFGE